MISNIKSNFFSSFIHLVSEEKVLSFWESSIQPSPFPWIITSGLCDPPSPSLPSLMPWAEHRATKAMDSKSSSILVEVMVSLSPSPDAAGNSDTLLYKYPRERYHLSNPCIDTSHRYLICHLGLPRPVGFKVCSSSSLDNHKSVGLIKTVVHPPQLLVINIPFCNTHFRTMVLFH